MKVLTSIKDFESHLLSIRFENRSYPLWFRGHGRTSYLLKPNITRHNHTVDTLIVTENQEIKRLQQKIASSDLYVPDNSKLPISEWLLLMQAQHLRYQTRLIDWTINLRVALYFAVENEKYHDEDGHLCILLSNAADTLTDERLICTNPKELLKTVLINASHSHELSQYLGERRRSLQMGKFSISPYKESLIALEENEAWRDRIKKIRIPSISKKHLKQELAQGGITHDTIYVRESKYSNTL